MNAFKIFRLILALFIRFLQLYSHSFKFSQNASGATFVTQIQATDKDKSNSQNLFYTISKGNEVRMVPKMP